MTYRDYIKLAENLGLERKFACCYYMGHCICIFWFDNSRYIDEQEMLNRTGKVNLLTYCEGVNESTDKEQIRDFIIKRIEDIKAIMVDNKLKTMEKDFE